MDKMAQIKKAEDFLALHHDPKLLVLPNIWDPLGARLLESLGYPAVATASAAVAFSRGYDDGQKITFVGMLEVINRIATAVTVPVTADVERGYAESPEDVAENIRNVIRAGAVGINLEDGTAESGSLFPVDLQCAKIAAIRDVADQEGIPLVINARTDVFLRESRESRDAQVIEAIDRAKDYLAAGADCIYPITVGDLATLNQIYAEINAPINVYAAQSTASMRELESAGISRLSLGPGLMKASLATMKRICEELLNYGSYDLFTKDVVSSDELARYVSPDKMLSPGADKNATEE